MRKRRKNNKTFWQMVYSFFGFWTYTLTSEKDGKIYRVVYWCFLPWGKFFRKFDVWRIDITKEEIESFRQTIEKAKADSLFDDIYIRSIEKYIAKFHA